MRFDNREDVVKELNKLVQDKNIEKYVEKFLELKSLMNALNLTLPEAYYISSFLVD
jgi:predicted DNA-binding WGR domain protein